MASEGRRKAVKIAVIGDEKVGKTSLVVAAANESFPDMCPPVVPPASLPADSTPEGVPFHIIDTSSRPEERPILEQICLTADVIVLLFDTAGPQSLKRISSYWMPELRRLGVHAPVILVGTKNDLGKQREQELSTVAQPIMRRFREIETCLECSAKRLIHVGEVFYFALKTVVHPVAPLFDPHAENGMGALKPLCIRALKRVFIMNDLDKDGALSDAELNSFQVNCFSAPLQPEELIGVRRVVSESMPQGVNATGLTLPGFLFLHALFIERGRLETVWAVLRKYGYNNDLTLNQEILSEISFAHSPDQVVELTEAGRSFFGQKFTEFDKDSDGLLNTAEQVEMFSTAPTGPWRGEEYKGLRVETGGEGREAGALTLAGLLAKWAFTTATDPVKTLAYVRYLGFEGSAAPLFAISKPRRQERKSEQLQRSVLQAFVFLGAGAGKGVLLEGIVGKSQPADGSTSSNSSPPTVAVGEVPSPDATTSSSCTLILHELDQEAVPLFEREPEGLGPADVAAFTFDSSSVESFRQAVDQLQRVAQASGDTLPCLLVAFEDQPMHQDVVAECGIVCADLALRQPLAVSLASGGPPRQSAGRDDIAAVFQALVNAAARPEQSLAIPQTLSLKATKRYQQNMRRAALYMAGGIVGGLACYALYKAYRNQSSMHSDSGTSGAPPGGLEAAPQHLQ